MDGCIVPVDPSRVKRPILMWFISLTNVKMVTRLRLSPSLLVWARTFEAVVRCQSFTKAAQDLCITQGAVSQQVRQLEDWAGKTLLVRSARSLVPTPEGQRLAAALTTSLQAIEQALAQIRSADANQSLLLSCSPSFAMSWLTPRLGDFYRRLPEVGLKVMAEFHPLDARRMHAEGLAAALRYDLGHYPDLVSHPVLEEFLLPVASPRFMAEHPEIRSAADLDGALLLHDEAPWAGAQHGEEWQQWLQHAGSPKPAAWLAQGRSFNLSLLASEAAAAHQGMAMGRLTLVLGDLLAGRLCAPFPMVLRSRAAYFLVSAGGAPDEVESVRGWLVDQAQGFREQRDPLLKQWALL